jgi:hypothetical protein
MAGPPQSRAPGMMLGLLQLARGRREGLSQFEASSQGFLGSLAPWIAFLLVDGFVTAVRGRAQEGALQIAVLLCLLLAPAVISQGLSLAWKRDQRWLRYITASTWCEWLMPMVTAIGWVLANLLVSAGLPSKPALMVLLVGVSSYWLWLHFFLARAALDLSRFRACLMVAALVAGNAALIGLAFGLGGKARAMFGA